MAQSKLKPNWEDVPPRDWEEEQTRRIGAEIKRLRGKRSAQWLSDRTRELGCPVTRAVISDVEVGRRRYVTVTELVVIALALDTAPVALIYPAPYWDRIAPFPLPEGGSGFEVTKLWAAQWFSGLSSGVDVDLDGQLIELRPLTKAMNVDANVKALERARRAARLADLRHRKKLELRRLREGKGSEDEIADLAAEIDDLGKDIEELRSLGSRDLTAEAMDALCGRRGDRDGG